MFARAKKRFKDGKEHRCRSVKATNGLFAN